MSLLVCSADCLLFDCVAADYASHNNQLEQLILPAITADGKTGLDDFLVHHGKNFLGEITNLIQNTATVVNPDLRALTSAENGEQGGRQPIIQTIVEEFINEHQVPA